MHVITNRIKPILALLLVAGCSLFASATQLQGGSVWPKFHANNLNTGVGVGSGSQGLEKWQFSTGMSIVSSPVIGANGTIYCAGEDDNVYAIDPKTGLQKWSYTTGNMVGSTPAIGLNGNVYVGSDDDNVYALNGATGALIWQYTTGGNVVSSPAIGSDGTVYIGSTDNSVYALSGSTGILVWQYTTGNSIESSPAIGPDGTVYVGSDDNTLYALNGATGAIVSSFGTGDHVVSSPTIGPDGTVYVGSNDGNLYAISMGIGVKWTFTSGGSISSSPAIGPDGTIYVGSSDNNVYALNGATGAVKWSYTTGDQVTSSPAIASDGTIYVGSWDTLLYALDSATGSMKWNFSSGAPYHSSPAIGADGTVYTGSDYGAVFALGSIPWPQFRGNAQNTGVGIGSGSAGNLAWSYLASGSVGTSPAVGLDGSICFGASNSKVYSLTSTGALNWSFSTNASVSESPAIGNDGTVYVGSNSGTFYAINGSTGARIWSHATGLPYVFSSPAIGANGYVYSSCHSVLYAFESASGTVAWSSSAYGLFSGSLAIGPDGTLYVANRSGNVYAINGSTGAQIWSQSIGSEIDGSPALGPDGSIYFGALNKNIYSLNGSTGAINWSYATPYGISSSPALGADGTVYVSAPFFLYALNGSTGALKWVNDTLSTVSPVIGSDGTVYFGGIIGDAGAFEALNPQTGALVWSYQTNSTSSPAIGADGTIYFGNGHTLLALGSAGMAGLTFAPATVIGGSSATATVTFSSPAGVNGNLVTISGNSPGLPSNVTVASGNTTASFSVGTSPVYNAGVQTISATYNGTTDYAYLTVTPPTVSGFSLSSNSIIGGVRATGTITLSGPAGIIGTTIFLQSSSADVTVPAWVIMASGATTMPVSFPTALVSSTEAITLTATSGSSSQPITLTLNPYSIASVSLTPSQLMGGQATYFGVNLNGPAGAGGVTVNLSSSSGDASIVSSLTVSQGSSSASVQVHTLSVSSQEQITISATYNSVTTPATLTLTPAALTGFRVAPNSVLGGASTAVAVYLNIPAGPGGLAVGLSSSSADVTVPSSVTVPQGAAAANVAVQTAAVSSSEQVTLYAALGSVTLQATLTVSPPILAGINTWPKAVIGGQRSALAVYLNGRALAGGMNVSLSSSSADAVIANSVSIPQGSGSANVMIHTLPVSAPEQVTMSATLGSVTLLSTLTLNPAALTGVKLLPQSVVGGNSSAFAVYLNGPAGPGGTVVTLSSQTNAAGMPATVTVPQGANSANVVVTTVGVLDQLHINLSATLGSVTLTRPITINPAVAVPKK